MAATCVAELYTIMQEIPVPLMVAWTEVPARPAVVGSGKEEACTRLAGPRFVPKMTNREPRAIEEFGKGG